MQAQSLGARWDAAKKTNGVWVLWVRQNVGGCALFYKSTCIQHSNSVAHVADNAKVV